MLTLLAEPDDINAVTHSFAVLVLSEVGRADRIKPQFIDQQRQALVEPCAGFMQHVRDYGGFDEAIGWRHRVAHSADGTLQLAINPGVDAADVVALMRALATQIALLEHGYRFGEPERLVRAVFYAHQRAALDEALWGLWFDQLIKPAVAATRAQAAMDL